VDRRMMCEIIGVRKIKSTLRVLRLSVLRLRVLRLRFDS